MNTKVIAILIVFFGIVLLALGAQYITEKEDDITQHESVGLDQEMTQELETYQDDAQLIDQMSSEENIEGLDDTLSVITEEQSSGSGAQQVENFDEDFLEELDSYAGDSLDIDEFESDASFEGLDEALGSV